MASLQKMQIETKTHERSRKFHERRERGRKGDIGRIGETYAAHFLQACGYHIVDTNFRIRGGEIDLVAESAKDECAKADGNPRQLVFIEVKTRTSSTFGTGEEAFSWRKQQLFLRSSREYLIRNFLKHGQQIPETRHDLIEINLDRSGNVQNLSHFEDVCSRI